MRTLEEIQSSKNTIHIPLIVDGREVWGDLCGRSRPVPYVSYTVDGVAYRVEFTWGAILRSVNKGEMLYA